MNILIILITALSAFAVPILRELPPEPNIDSNGDQKLFADALNRIPNPSEIHRRFKRASDRNLDTHVSNLKMVARVTNGIYLIQGLTSGTIDSEELISEILRFGTVTPTQISAIDSAKVQTALSDMKTLPDELEANDNMKKVEKVFGGLKAILKEVDGIGSLTEWKDGKELFKTEIGRLAKDGLNITDVSTMLSGCNDWGNNYPKLTGTAPSIADIHEAMRVLIKIKEASMGLNMSPIFWRFSNFTFAADGMSPIFKAQKGVALFRSLSRDDALAMVASDGVDYINQTQLITGKINDLSARLADVQTVRNLLESRGNKKRQLRHTTGLSNGAADFSSILDDISDPWIVKLIKTKSLKVALNQLEGLAGISKKLDGSLRNNLGIETLSDFLDSMSDISKEVVAAQSGIPQGYKCARHLPDDVDTKNFKDLSDAVILIDQKLLILNTNREKLLEAVKSSGIIGMCDDLLAICNKMKADGSNILEIVAEIKGYKNIESMTTQIKTFGDFALTIKGLNGGTGIQVDAVTANGNINSLDDYQKALWQYSNYFKCLQDLDQLKLVFKAIDGLKKIRSWKQDAEYSKSLVGGFQVVEKVAGITGGIDKMRTSIKGLTDLKTPETDALKEFQEAGTHSEVIGKSVQVLAEMSGALKLEDDLLKVVNNIDVVEKEKRHAVDPNDLASLDKLVALPPDITSMFASLNTFTKTLGQFSESENLANQSEIFVSAQKVSGITGDFSSMRKAVGGLIKISNGPELAQLGGVEDGLKALESLDLDFAGFQKSLGRSKESLTALDLFFAKIWKKFLPTTPIPVQRPTLGLVTSTQDDEDFDALVDHENSEEKQGDDDALKIGGGIGAVVLVILGAVILLLYFFKRDFLKKFTPCLCWNKKKDKGKKGEKQPFINEPSPSPQPQPQPPPKPPAEPPKPPAEPPKLRPQPPNLTTPVTTNPIVPPPLLPFLFPAARTIADLLKMFLDTLMTEFENFRLSHNLGKEPLVSCAYKYYEETYNNVKNKLPANDTTPPELTDCRFNNPLYVRNRPVISGYGDRFSNNFLHANIVKFEKHGDWILTERPQKASEAIPATDKNEAIAKKNSTIGKFWWMAKQFKSQSVVMFTSAAENEDYQYYPQEVGQSYTEGDLTVKCTKLDKKLDDLLEIRNITGKFGDEPEFTLTHYAYVGWLDQSFPITKDVLIMLLETLAKDTEPAIVHCSDGLDRTGVFTLAALIIDRLKKHNEVNLEDCVKDIMTIRRGSIDCPISFANSVHICLSEFAEGVNMDEQVRTMYRDILHAHGNLYTELKKIEALEMVDTVNDGKTVEGKSKETGGENGEDKEEKKMTPSEIEEERRIIKEDDTLREYRKKKR